MNRTSAKGNAKSIYLKWKKGHSNTGLMIRDGKKE